MTDNDRHLIALAEKTRTDDDYIDSLIPKADTEECRRRLRDLSFCALHTANYMAFDRDYDD